MLEISNLNAGYGEVTVLRNFSCRIETGQVTALMGRNGMGKTTLMKSIMGLIPVKSGTIHLNGIQINGKETYKISRAGIGYVPQGREVFEQFTVAENLRLAALGSSLSNLDRLPQIHDWFPILKERHDQKAGTFSGGQQQVLAIARALMTGPEILLLDEPTEGIQPNIVHEISLQLARIARETGLTILVVEQNVDMVRTMADHILFMENGQLADQCSAEELRSDETLIHRYLSI
ncbi:ABC transporter ATP-binding protein [Sneathiella chinensis]|uniref:ABC transporter ATP-binding protein n=1 Tax=Sneathiella chinensis TaxID=349750 RepID=A0ABQ5U5U9_9PROT|nr:ABC transporter ATP-binding protein [Sneathiella chinensis]GLQ06639.1 ABC transporter ATP-binding protein [Sneathiella chinensis]